MTRIMRSSSTAMALLCTIIPILLQSQQVAGQYVSDQSQDLAKRDSQSSSSRDIYIAGNDDFCIFGPAAPGAALSQGDRNVVSWCNKGGHNTRVMPEGTLKGVTYIKAQNWVQVSGVGDLTKINIKTGDWGGQFDSVDHKPEGAKIMGGSDKKEATSWVTLMTPDTFCFRACFGDAAYCPTTFAEKGCYALLSNGVGPEGTFQSCTSKDGLPPGQQGDKAPEWVDCRTGGNGGDGNQIGGSPANGDQSTTTDIGTHAATPTTSWVGVPTCIPCTGAPSSSTSASSTNSEISGTIQQGVTKVGDGLVAKESDLPSFILAPPPSSTGSASGGLILKRAEETVTKDGQCCFTTWTPTVIGANAGPTTSPHPSDSSMSSGGAITGVNPLNVTNTALITNSSTSLSGSGPKSSGNASVTGGGKNGTNATGGNGTESYGSRVVWGAEGLSFGWTMGGAAMAAVWTLAGGWSIL